MGCVVNIILISLMIVPVAIGKKRNITIHNPEIDIMLVLDESKSMINTQFKSIYDGFRQWVKWYYVGNRTNVTHFAVIGCNDKVVRLHLNDKQDADKVAAQILEEIPGGHDNLKECFNVTFDIQGDRETAPNVWLFITDCQFTYNPAAGPKYEEKFYKQIEDVASNVRSSIRNGTKNSTGYFAFVCLLVEKNNTLQLIDDTNMNESVMRWVGYDSGSVIYFANTTQLAETLDEKLPKITITVEDCEYTDIIATNCTATVKRNVCEILRYPIIVTPHDHPRAIQCPENETKYCDCRSINGYGSSVEGNNESTSSGGNVRDSSVEGNNKNTSSVRDSSVEGNNGNTNDGDNVMSPGGETEEKTYMIIGFVIGGLLLFIVLVVVIVLVVINRRRRKNRSKVKEHVRKGGKIAGVSELDPQEKKKGVQASISVHPGSKVSKKTTKKKFGTADQSVSEQQRILKKATKRKFGTADQSVTEQQRKEKLKGVQASITGRPGSKAARTRTLKNSRQQTR